MLEHNTACEAAVRTRVRTVMKFPVKFARMEIIGKCKEMRKTYDFLEVLFEQVHVREAIDRNHWTVGKLFPEMIQRMGEVYTNHL